MLANGTIVTTAAGYGGAFDGAATAAALFTGAPIYFEIRIAVRSAEAGEISFFTDA